MHIYRTRFKKDIVCEFLPPARKMKKQKVIIICGGMPGGPDKSQLLNFLSQKGFWVFNPRYRGTWESQGKFLKDSPEKDIRDVISAISKPLRDVWSDKVFKVKADELYIIGSSFGGPAAILLSGDQRVTKSVAIAPVTDWQSKDMIRTDAREYRFTRLGFGDAYRFSDRDWQKLSKGKFYNPVHEAHRVKGGKLLIIHAKDDDIVAFGPSKKFAKKVKAKFTPLAKGGHLGSALLLKPNMFRKVQSFLK